MLDATMTSMMNTSKRGNVTMAWIPTRNEFSLKKRSNDQFQRKGCQLAIMELSFLDEDISVIYAQLVQQGFNANCCPVCDDFIQLSIWIIRAMGPLTLSYDGAAKNKSDHSFWANNGDHGVSSLSTQWREVQWRCRCKSSPASRLLRPFSHFLPIVKCQCGQRDSASY